jgi:chromosome segregation ATPase
MKQETFRGTEDDTESEQEEIEEKMRYAEEEIVNLININEELKSELNYELEEKASLKEQLEEANGNG